MVIGDDCMTRFFTISQDSERSFLLLFLRYSVESTWYTRQRISVRINDGVTFCLSASAKSLNSKSVGSENDLLDEGIFIYKRVYAVSYARASENYGSIPEVPLQMGEIG